MNWQRTMQTNALTPDKEEYDEAPARLRGDLWGNVGSFSVNNVNLLQYTK